MVVSKGGLHMALGAMLLKPDSSFVLEATTSPKLS
jgi:hypothetical protein